MLYLDLQSYECDCFMGNYYIYLVVTCSFEVGLVLSLLG